MRRTALEPGRDRILIAAFWALGAILFKLPYSEPLEVSVLPQIVSTLLLILCTGGLLLLTFWAFYTRATVRGETLTLHALRRRDRLECALNAIVGYHIDKVGDWWIHTRPEGTTYRDPAERTRVAVREPWELHRFFVEVAPKKLGGRRWRFPGDPPKEEFTGLWFFDVERFASRALPQLAGILTGAVIGFLLTHHRNLGAIGQPLSLLLIPLILIWERLDVTAEGIVHRSPLHRRTIRWDDVRAVFQEGGKARRSFVFVGPECSIHIPPHLAIDTDLMKKVFYSLPAPILCVNFDETTFRGYKSRKKAHERTPTRNEDLLPALTA